MGVENGEVMIGNQEEKRTWRKIFIHGKGWERRLLTDEEYDRINHASGNLAYDVENAILKNSQGDSEAARANRRWLYGRE